MWETSYWNQHLNNEISAPFKLWAQKFEIEWRTTVHLKLRLLKCCLPPNVITELFWRVLHSLAWNFCRCFINICVLAILDINNFLAGSTFESIVLSLNQNKRNQGNLLFTTFIAREEDLFKRHIVILLVIQATLHRLDGCLHLVSPLWQRFTFCGLKKVHFAATYWPMQNTPNENLQDFHVTYLHTEYWNKTVSPL